jgi:hypothetical protein
MIAIKRLNNCFLCELNFDDEVCECFGFQWSCVCVHKLYIYYIIYICFFSRKSLAEAAGLCWTEFAGGQFSPPQCDQQKPAEMWILPEETWDLTWIWPFQKCDLTNEW